MAGRAPADEGRSWSLAFAALLLTASLAGYGAVSSVRTLDEREDTIAHRYTENALRAERLLSALEEQSADKRAFLLTGDEAFVEHGRAARAAFHHDLDALRANAATEDDAALVERVLEATAAYEAALEQSMDVRRGHPVPDDAVTHALESAAPAKTRLERLLVALAAREHQLLVDAQRSASYGRDRVVGLVILIASSSVVIIAVLASLLRRALARLTAKREELEQSLHRVEQSNRDLDAFAGRVAHDVRNALAPMTTGVSLLRTGELTPEQTALVFDRIDRSTHRTAALIDALLAFSRAAQQVDPNASASMSDAVSGALEQLDPLVAQVDATVTSRVDDVNVNCPPGLLDVVIVNIVGNAVKFLRGRPERRVEIETRIARGGCELRVADTGPGIPESARERVFEPFYRVPDTTEPGTGIGLAAVRRILDACGGHARISAREPSGTVFVIWLPLAEALLAARPERRLAAGDPS